MSLANIHMNIFESPGYYILPGLLPDELSRLREVIKAEYIGRISEVYPELVDHCARLDMSEYHKLSMFMDHKLLWGKRKERILTPGSVAQISTLSMFSVLDRVFPVIKFLVRRSQNCTGVSVGLQLRKTSGQSMLIHGIGSLVMVLHRPV